MRTSKLGQLGFQVVRIRMVIIWQFGLWSQNLIVDFYFNLISISFRLKSNKFDQFLIKQLKKMHSILIKISKSRLKDWNSQFIYVFSISLNQFQNFDIIRTWFNWYRRADCFGFQEFGSKMLIKWWFESDSRQNTSLSRFNRLNLAVWYPDVQIPDRILPSPGDRNLDTKLYNPTLYGYTKFWFLSKIW